MPRIAASLPADKGSDDLQTDIKKNSTYDKKGLDSYIAACRRMSVHLLPSTNHKSSVVPSPMDSVPLVLRQAQHGGCSRLLAITILACTLFSATI
jgi:hypothetical protein